jgi:hypothetical protein
MESPQEGLEKKILQARAAEVVSNMNDLRTDQMVRLMEAANRELEQKGKGFLDPARRIVLAERNPEYLQEILAKMLPEFCPNHLVSYENHHLPHYVVRDGRVETYTNLDGLSTVVLVQARVKHPCSLAEKIPRKAQYFGRVSEFHNKHKLMVGDVIGVELVVRTEEDVDVVGRQLLALPYFKLEHFEAHRKPNGYTADHYNMTYSNGNPMMRGLELEVQVTDMKNYLASKHDQKQGHETAYGAEKLASPHKMPDGKQLVIFGNSVQIPQCIPVKKTGGLLVAQINGVQEYTLVVPREN